MNQFINEIVENRYDIAGIKELFLPIINNIHYQKWKDKPHAFCFYGNNQYSRNIQINAIKEVFRLLSIPFHIIYRGEENKLNELLRYKNVIFLTNEFLVPIIKPLSEKIDYKVLLLWRYYDDTPNKILAPVISKQEKFIIKDSKEKILFIISELSYEGNERYLRGYVKELDIPVLSFPWAADLKNHIPFNCQPKRDLLYIGTYYEKAKRINEYFDKPLKRYLHTVIGPDWERSPFRWIENSIIDSNGFNNIAPQLYSSHLISLNIHHDFEVDGYSCNERIFNSIACGGFLISDYTKRLREFFEVDEIVTASEPEEYYEKIVFFLENPEARISYMEKSLEKIYSHHTYHHRIADLLSAIFCGKTISPYCSILEK